MSFLWNVLSYHTGRKDHEVKQLQGTEVFIFACNLLDHPRLAILGASSKKPDLFDMQTGPYKVLISNLHIQHYNSVCGEYQQ